jgi:F-type H+-transporting ATPase subunit alpha
MSDTVDLTSALDDTFDALEDVLRGPRLQLQPREIGTVASVGEGIARVTGLPHAGSEELLRFAGGFLGMVFNLDAGEVGVILLDEPEEISAGQEVQRTGRVLDIPVGEGLLGRVIDPVGRPLDEKGPVRAAERRPVEREALRIMHRAPVDTPLQTGIKVIDALFPIGRGQRELIVGDRQTGKTAIAVDTILNQKDQDVVCIYCGIGKQKAAVAQVIGDLQASDALEYSVVVSAGSDAPAGQQYAAPYAATTIAEYFMEQGRDALIVYDDLTWHARAYRELSLLLRRPPGREAYPGDIFYIHSRLLERATRLREEHGGGSLTALPVVETQAQNLSAYIPTNLISITDGQIYLSPTLFQRGILPAVDVGKSVSRVGGKAQLPAYRAVSGKLRLSYSQFQELEAFSRFSTRLDAESRRTIERGQRVREVLKQNQYATIPVAEQLVVLLAVTAGLFDLLELDQLERAEQVLREGIRQHHADLVETIEDGDSLTDEDREELLETSRRILEEAFDQDFSEGNLEISKEESTS